MISKILKNKWTKASVFVLCLWPLARLGWKALHGGLGANPIEYITHDTGDWILIFLVLTLSITPARKLLHTPDLIRFRKMLGLYAFFYACLHFCIYIVLDKFFDFSDIWQDIAKRKYITVGFTGFLLLIPLAITSTTGMIRRLGGKRWQRLHQLVYLTAIAGFIHYYWLVKSNVTKPLLYGAMFLMLFAYRIAVKMRDKAREKQKRSEALARPMVSSAP